MIQVQTTEYTAIHGSTPHGVREWRFVNLEGSWSFFIHGNYIEVKKLAIDSYKSCIPSNYGIIKVEP